MYHQFNIQQFYVLPTQCIYVVCVGLRTNSDYFPIQNYLTGFNNGKVVWDLGLSRQDLWRLSCFRAWRRAVGTNVGLPSTVSHLQKDSNYELDILFRSASVYSELEEANTDMRCLTTGIRFEKCVVRRLSLCVKVHLHKLREYSLLHT